VPSWSRDGRWVYFASNRGGSWQVWKKPIDGGPARQLTRNGGFAAFESPDGQFVYYAKGRSVSGLWRIPSSGGEENVVYAGLRPGYWGYWGLCSKGVFYANQESGERYASLFQLDPAGRGIRIGEANKPLMLADSAFAVSPDCKQILYTQKDQSGSDIMMVEISANGR
jgi:Tol biopolymer transport system component